MFAAGPLFPTPLHITRQLHDSISDKTIVLNEYGYGNRLISVRGSLTSIADYEKGVLTEIDRDAGTYSVTRFDVLAKAAQSIGSPEAAAVEKNARPLRSVGAKLTKIGRTAEFFEGDIDAKSFKQTIEVAVDRSVKISKDALEVLLGAAYPGVRRSEHEIVLSAAAPTRLRAASQAADSPAAEPPFALPIEQVVTYQMEGQTLEFRSSVIRVGSEPPPADVVSIPAGARLVVSRIVAVQREIDQLTNPTLPPPRN